MLPSRPAGRGGCPRPPRDRRVSLGSQLFLHLALGPGLNPQTLAAHQHLTQSQRGCAPRTSCASTPSNFAGPRPDATWLASWQAVDDAGWQAELGCTCCPRTSHPRLASPAANSAISRETQSPAMLLAHRHLQCFSSCSTPRRTTLSLSCSSTLADVIHEVPSETLCIPGLLWEKSVPFTSMQPPSIAQYCREMLPTKEKLGPAAITSGKMKLEDTNNMNWFDGMQEMSQSLILLKNQILYFPWLLPI